MIRVQNLAEVEVRTPEQIKARWGGGGLRESAPPKLPGDAKKSEDALDAVFGIEEKKKEKAENSRK
jgi:hypothetical protein